MLWSAVPDLLVRTFVSGGQFLLVFLQIPFLSPYAFLAIEDSLKQRLAYGMTCMKKAERVNESGRLITHIGIQVRITTRKSNRIALEIPAPQRCIVAEAVLMPAGLLVEILPWKAQTLRDGAGDGGLAEGLVGDDPDERLAAIGGELRRPEPVCMEKGQLASAGRQGGDGTVLEIEVVGLPVQTVPLLQELASAVVLIQGLGRRLDEPLPEGIIRIRGHLMGREHRGEPSGLIVGQTGEHRRVWARAVVDDADITVCGIAEALRRAPPMTWASRLVAGV